MWLTTEIINLYVGLKKQQRALIADGNSEEENELFCPCSLSFDQQNHHYVADHSNHRVQRFPLKQTH